MAKVSIIIPAYNPGRFLRETLESVHAQTFEDWELLVIDDNSSEDLSWVPREFPRARWVRQPHGGASVARNRGILMSTGEYVALLDQDDVWRPHHLEHAVAAMDGCPDAAICYCDLAYIDGESRLMGAAELPAEDVAAAGETVLDGCSAPVDGESRLYQSVRHFATRFIVPATVTLRRSALGVSGLMDPLIPFSGDFDMIIKLGAHFKVLHVPLVQTLYRVHGNSFSYQYDVGRRELETVIARYEAYARSKGDVHLARDARKLFRRPRRMYSAQAFECARGCYRQRRYRALLYHLFRAWCFSPAFVMGSLVQFRTKPAVAR